MQKLAKSLSIFRGKINTVKKDSNNPFFKSKYADLPAILDAIKDPLSESGLALYHRATVCDGCYSLWTHIVDVESGEETISEFPLFGTKPQELGSSITYARRYNILSLLDIPTDEDDDGNIANTAKKTKNESETSKKEVWFNDSDFKEWTKSGCDYSIEAFTQYMYDNGFTRASDAMKEKVKNHISNN